MTWRRARALDTLLAQVNTAHPGRSTRSDGTIGDAAHASTASDHNPDPAGVVRASDITHDPAHGLDAPALAAALIASRDPRIKYVISNSRISSATIAPWTWRKYTGTDPHTSHVHVSVVPGTAGDDAQPWALPTPEDTMPLTPADVQAIVVGLLTAKLGTAGPTVAVALQRSAAQSAPTAAAITAAVIAALPAGQAAPSIEDAVRRVFADAGTP